MPRCLDLGIIGKIYRTPRGCTAVLQYTGHPLGLMNVLKWFEGFESNKDEGLCPKAFQGAQWS
jgi:hypothetical protein